MPKPLSLADSLDDNWAELVESFRFSREAKDAITLEYARARDRHIGDWADRAESLDGLTRASREGVEARRRSKAA